MVSSSDKARRRTAIVGEIVGVVIVGWMKFMVAMFRRRVIRKRLRMHARDVIRLQDILDHDLPVAVHVQITRNRESMLWRKPPFAQFDQFRTEKCPDLGAILGKGHEQHLSNPLGPIFPQAQFPLLQWAK